MAMLSRKMMSVSFDNKYNVIFLFSILQSFAPLFHSLNAYLLH